LPTLLCCRAAAPIRGRREHRPHARRDQFLPGSAKSAAWRLNNLPARFAEAVAGDATAIRSQRIINLLAHILPVGPAFAFDWADIEQERPMTAQPILSTPSPLASERALSPADPAHRGADARAAFLALLGGAAGPLAIGQPSSPPGNGGNEAADALIRMIDNAAAENERRPATVRLDRGEGLDDEPVPTADAPPTVDAPPTPRRRDDEAAEAVAETEPSRPGDAQPEDTDPLAASESAPASAVPANAKSQAIIAAAGGQVLGEDAVRVGSPPPTDVASVDGTTRGPARDPRAGSPVPTAAKDTPTANPAKDGIASGQVRINVSRDAEQLLSRPASTLSAAVNGTALSAQAGATGERPFGDAHRGKPGTLPSGHAIALGSAGSVRPAAGQTAVTAIGNATTTGSATVTGLQPTGPGIGGAIATAATPSRLETAATATPQRPYAQATKPVIEQVSVDIRKAIETGNDRINIQLRPASLGRIEVRLELAIDGRVQAMISADRPETLDMLQRDARGLERALQDAGLRADSHSLSFNLRGGHASTDDNRFAGCRDHESGDEPGSAETELETIMPEFANHTAPGDGGIDIRV
jgi:flagellar hook-length control protein FliK